MKQFQLTLLAFFVGFQLFAQSKVGTIDVDYIISKMPELEQVSDAVKVYSSDLENQLQVKITKYQSLIKVYQENEATYTETDKKAKQDEIITLENEIKQFQQNSGSMIQIKQNEMLGPLYQKIGEAMNKVAAEDKYTQIFTIDNSIAYLDPNYDITITVMEILGLPIEDPANTEGKN
jgi:outer membrane protein